MLMRLFMCFVSSNHLLRVLPFIYLKISNANIVRLPQIPDKTKGSDAKCWIRLLHVCLMDALEVSWCQWCHWPAAICVDQKNVWTMAAPTPVKRKRSEIQHRHHTQLTHSTHKTAHTQPTTLLYPTDEGTFPQPTGSDHPSHGYWRWVLPPPVGGSGPTLPTELCGCVRSSKLHDQGLLSTGPAAAQCHVHIVVRLQGGLVPFPRELDNLDCAGWHQKMRGSWQHTQERIGRLGSLWLGSWWMFAATSRAFRESCGVVPQQEGTAVATNEKSSLFSAQLGCWGRPCKEKVHTSELQRHSHCNWQILSALWHWKSTFWQQSSPGLLWCPFWLVSSRRRAASERRNTSRERIGRRNWGPV